MLNEKKPDTIYCFNHIIYKSRKDQTIVKERSTTARDGARGETMAGRTKQSKGMFFGGDGNVLYHVLVVGTQLHIFVCMQWIVPLQLVEFLFLRKSYLK